MGWHLRALAALALALLAALPASAERRVAFLVGNARYEAAGTLPNPAGDVALLRAALEAPPLAFEVETHADLTRAGMARAFSDFLARTRDADITLVFYAGHGLQFEGENYLVGVDARLATEFDLAAETLPLDAIVERLRAESRTALVFVDACRNNPLARSLMASVGATRAMGQGLAPVELAPGGPRQGGTMLAFSASPGQVALDGPAGGNSPFARSLATHIREPGIELLSVMKRVIGDVRDDTADAQVPVVTNDLAREIYLVAAPGEATGDAETVAFTAAVEAGSVDALAAYLRAFPQGRFAALAALELARLRDEAAAPVVADPVPDPAPAAGGVLDWGDDSSDWALDGECDDPRFEGTGMAPTLTALDEGRDATDCRAAWEAGAVAPVAAAAALASPEDAPPPEAAAPGTPTAAPVPAPVAYGDNTSEWSKDGECDDRRFAGASVSDYLGLGEIGRDSTDCRRLADSGAIRLWDFAAARAVTSCDAIEWGDDSGDYAKNGECDDARFDGPGAAGFLGPNQRGRDASDCRRLCRFGVIALRDY